MHSRIKKILVFALVLTMLMPLGSVFAAEEGNEVSDSQTTDNENG